MGSSKIALGILGLIVLGNVVVSMATKFFQNGTQQGTAGLLIFIGMASYGVFWGWNRFFKSSDA
ncbi:unnamed protein product [marine sediment metagenome]|uniref:Uncharacterized protein n=1 Tax=marine sediment metagenome TaxID=412755 RepID=X1DG81_9ZZZZ